MRKLKLWLVTRAFETPLWMSGVLGVTTLLVAMIAGGIEYYYSSQSNNVANQLCAIGFLVVWTALLGWSAWATLLLHDMYNRMSLLTARVVPDDRQGAENGRIRQAVSTNEQFTALAYRWKCYSESHLSTFCVAMAVVSIRFGLCESAHWSTNWWLLLLMVLALAFACLPQIPKAQFRTAKVQLATGD